MKFMYKIAELSVAITPYYPKMQKLLKEYESNKAEKTDIIIPMGKDFYIKKQSENPHLSIEECENIWQSWYFSTAIIKYSGMVLHASAMKYNSGAYLFSAGSGVGKSTHTTMWKKEFPNIQIINDDKPAIRQKDGKLYVYGTPWCGASYINTNIKVPLKAIIFLERSENNRIYRLNDTSEIFKRIYSNTIHKMSEVMMNMLLDLLDTLITETKFYILNCNESTEAVYTAKKAFDKEINYEEKA